MPESERIRVLIVDDHAIVRRGLRGLLEIVDDMEVVGDAADGEQAVRLAEARDPDVVLMDLSLPSPGGIEATQRIKRVIDRIALEKLAKAAPSDGILRGSLSQMNVVDLVQSLEMGRKSCSLTMMNGDDKCEMFFSQGQVKHAAYGSISGDEAVFKVLRWTDGNFEVDFDGKTTKETTTLNTQGLLMEGLRLLDESQRDATEGEDVLLDT